MTTMTAPVWTLHKATCICKLCLTSHSGPWATGYLWKLYWNTWMTADRQSGPGSLSPSVKKGTLQNAPLWQLIVGHFSHVLSSPVFAGHLVIIFTSNIINPNTKPNLKSSCVRFGCYETTEHMKSPWHGKAFSITRPLVWKSTHALLMLGWPDF